MQEKRTKMLETCNELHVKSVRWKIEKRVLEKIGHVLRMKDEHANCDPVVVRWFRESPKVQGQEMEDPQILADDTSRGRDGLERSSRFCRVKKGLESAGTKENNLSGGAGER